MKYSSLMKPTRLALSEVCGIDCDGEARIWRTELYLHVNRLSLSALYPEPI